MNRNKGENGTHLNRDSLRSCIVRFLNGPRGNSAVFFTAGLTSTLAITALIVGMLQAWD